MSFISGTLNKLALWAHVLHRDIYSYYKVRRLIQSNSGYFSPLERLFFLEFYPLLRDKDIVFYDIGAAQGTVSSCLAKLNNVSIIHAFEPNPKLYRQLVFSASQSPKIFCHNVALGSFDGVTSINISKKSHSSSILPIAPLHTDEFPGSEVTEQADINIFKLDSYVQQQQLPMPNLIKIDVQGYELNVLNGAVNTVRHAKYCILEMSFQELYVNCPLFEDIYQYMIELGFRLVGVSSPLHGKTYDQLQVDGYFENQFLLKV